MNQDMSPIGYIYGLFDPRFNQIRYIGQSIQPPKWRLAQHISGSKKEKTHKAHWIKSLLPDNIKPQLKVLGFFSLSQLDEMEIEFITNYRNLYGTDVIVNVSDGGSDKDKKHLYKKVLRSDGMVFESIKDAAIVIGVKASSITNCLKGINRSAKGFGFRYYVGHTETWSPKMRGDPIIRSDGKIYNNTSIAAKDMGIDRDGIYGCLKDANSTSGGYGFKYYAGRHETWPIQQRNFGRRIVVRSDGIEYPSIKAASIANNLSDSAISLGIKENRLVSKTYRFYFKIVNNIGEL
jgi:hypothetical protein